jgi:hypothetical protein
MDDFELKQERHRRQLMLMREMDKINRMETRVLILRAIAIGLLIVGLVGMML